MYLCAKLSIFTRSTILLLEFDNCSDSMIFFDFHLIILPVRITASSIIPPQENLRYLSLIIVPKV